MSPSAGELIERYQVLSKLGEGGMGVVLAAYDPVLDRRIALKLLRPGAFAGKMANQLRARLQREAQAMARFSHPNVVGVYDIGLHEGQLFIAMEYVRRDLTAWLAERERHWRDIVRIFAEAGRGLAAAHTAGLVHRDFKPANVLVGEDERARVSDFGLVSALDAGDEPMSKPKGRTMLDLTQTAPGRSAGTPAFMSPEQFMGRTVDARGDQFSYCVALYAALYGQRPFAGKDMPTLRHNVCAGKLIAPPLDSTVPPFLWQAIEKGLATKPADRWGSMDRLLVKLNNDPSVRSRRVSALDALLTFGRMRGEAGDVDNAEALLRQGLAEAASLGDDERMTVAAVDLAHVVGILAHRRDEALGLLSLAEAKLGLFDPHPMLLARLYNTRGSMHRNAHRADQAVADYDRCIERVEAHQDDTQIALMLGNRAVAHAMKHDFVAAHRDIQRAIALNDARADRVTYAKLLQSKAEILSQEERRQEALDCSRELLALQQAIHGEQSLAAGRVHNIVGGQLAQLGFHREAKGHFELFRDLTEQHLGPQNQMTVTALNNLGLTQIYLAEPEEAQGTLEQALALCEQYEGHDQEGIIAILTNLGTLRSNERELDKAMALFQRVLFLRERHAPHDALGMCEATGNIANTLALMGRYDEACVQFRASITRFEEQVGERQFTLGKTLSNFAMTIVRNPASIDLEQPLALLTRALHIVTSVLGPDDVEVGTVFSNLGEVTALRGEWLASRDHYQHAANIYRARFASDGSHLFPVLRGLGDALNQTGAFEEAREALDEAVALGERHHAEPVTLTAARVSLAMALWKLGEDKTRVTKMLSDAVDTFRSLGSEDNAAGVSAWLEAAAAKEAQE